MVIGWNTKKVAGGFEYRVYTVGYNVPSVTLKTGVVATRAQAMGQAKRWTRYMKLRGSAAPYLSHTAS